MTSIDLQKAREICDAATQGTYEYGDVGDWHVIAQIGPFGVWPSTDTPALYGKIPQGIEACEADAKYYSYLDPPTVRQMIDELEVYHHMKEVTKANGWDSIMAALVAANELEAKDKRIVELEALAAKAVEAGFTDGGVALCKLNQSLKGEK